MASTPILLITGANTGLGYETVRSLCQSAKAYIILLGGRSIDKANEAAEKIQAEFPKTQSSITTVQIDIEDDDSISQLAEHISSEYGRLDILINNAGKN
jgi:NAD(P)-dependent dehydrogenase (short-subunit alcohol dehydrogenase family)